MKIIWNKLKSMVVKSPNTPIRETPTPVENTIKVKVGVIVGHEKKAQGASLGKVSTEYKYNTEIANLMKTFSHINNLQVEVIYRDSVGITGAYKKAEELKCDVVIELHFNSFNTRAFGSETLCTLDSRDIEFATVVHEYMCKAFKREGLSRGLKRIPRSERGGINVYSFPNGVNCLVEPFFGDNEEDIKLALSNKKEYAESLLKACYAWAQRSYK